jgi:hypothetical protein
VLLKGVDAAVVVQDDVGVYDENFVGIGSQKGHGAAPDEGFGTCIILADTGRVAKQKPALNIHGAGSIYQ